MEIAYFRDILCANIIIERFRIKKMVKKITTPGDIILAGSRRILAPSAFAAGLAAQLDIEANRNPRFFESLPGVYLWYN